MKHLQPDARRTTRRGSTLVIVISLLGLLAFTGMVFYTFAAQERVASEYFSEAAKAQYTEPSDVWPHMLEQVIIGPSEQYRGSKLYSSSRRHSLISNLVGSDIYPHTGKEIRVEYNGSGFPEVVSTPAAADEDPTGISLLDFVDSPASRGGSVVRSVPEPDVDYTYPDINNLFLAYKGWAIREDSSGGYTQVPVIIPSFFRPQYMRAPYSTDADTVSTGPQKDFGTDTANARTNPDWAYAYTLTDPPTPVDITDANRDTVLFQNRSFRPHPSDIAGLAEDGSTVTRYITEDEATAMSLGAGGFPFLPEDANGNGLHGDLGIWTVTYDPSKPLESERFDAKMYELDADNDNDRIKEGIWLDLHFPVQEFTDSSGNVRRYVVLHSVTIYDLDGLFNLNVHGNLAGLSRTGTLPDAVSSGEFSDSYLSRSHHGLGPNEINPIWGLRKDTLLSSGSVHNYMVDYFDSGSPSNRLEQANMEWTWLLMGRLEFENDDFTERKVANLHGGRWGDKNLLYNTLEVATPRRVIAEMPRPGLAGNVYESISSGQSFGGRNGIDDNQNAEEGEAYVEFVDHDGDAMTADIAVVYRRPFRHPVSWSGRGRRTQVDEPVYDSSTQQFDFTTGDEFFASDSPLLPVFLRDQASPGAEQWPGYLRYGAASSMTADPIHYVFGPNEVQNNTNSAFMATGGGDDLNHLPTFDGLIEDPLEVIFDQDKADRVADGIAAIGDLVAMHWPSSPAIALSIAEDTISTHLTDLAPHALALDSDNREMFTTLSNSLRYIAMQRNDRRVWEYTADTDGSDNDDDGYPDGDSVFEFPPSFGTTDTDGRPYSATDPFRPQVRRLLTNEAGENRDLIGALPLSINHILDVDRTNETPAEGSPQFLRYMQRSGLRFRSLTEHPHITNFDDDGPNAIEETDLITLELPATSDSDVNTVPSVTDVAYPPTNFSEQEFWARRDRQQLARDIYVLLYTLGGAEIDDNGTGGDPTDDTVRDYTANNDPLGGAGVALYTHDQLRRMAQFAVNMVDAMDTDNVITKFEYDKNLGDGWNLDDDAYSEESTPLAPGDTNYVEVTKNGMYVEDSATRGVVYGVEAQEFAFSEVLGITSNEVSAGNHDATLHDDTTGDRHHLFIELRNMLPRTIDLATAESTDENTGIFRIARYDRVDVADPVAPASGPTAAITFETDAGSVPGGGHFTIGTASTDGTESSDYYLDFDLDGNYDLIAPDVTLGTLPTAGGTLTPQCDLDLIHTSHNTNRFTITDSGQNVETTPGAFLASIQTYAGTQGMIDLSTVDVPNAGGEFSNDSRNGFDLVIQRRLNPHMPSLASTAGQTADVNPWVEIDRIRVLFDELNLQDSDTATELPTRLVDVRSFERREPLNDNSRSRVPLPAAVTDHRNNSIGNEFNITSLQDPTQPFDATTNPVVQEAVWQPHFDREFTSAGELLNLPVYGPNLTTQRLSFSRLSPYRQVDVANTATLNHVSGASAMFLWPDMDPATATNTENDNRWYRLFQFTEVPSRVHRMLGNYVNQNRLPGKININMIRHLEVFAGLVDDPMFADVDGNRLISPFLNDSTTGLSAAERDRWQRYLRERDGAAVEGYYDPTPTSAGAGSGDESTSFLIPGVPGAEPFRSYAYQEDDPNAVDDNGLERTMLRTSTLAGGGSDNRHWLEVGTAGNHDGPAVSTTPMERHQVLSKIMNNTTTVSNTFVMFATAGYFEAVEDATGFIRVGGRLNIISGDSVSAAAGNESFPGSRQKAVFVIDRTEAFNAYDPASGDFDWERLVKYQAIIE